jgi:predicted DNA binding protein
MNPVAEDILMHYGVKRRSGRYPWGSGDSPYQHSGDFISRVDELARQGLNEKQRADALGLTTTDLRMQLRVAKHERRGLEADRAKSLRDDGKSLNEIAEIMGYKNDSSIRALLNENTAVNKNRAQVTADVLKKELETKGMIDVGAGAERELGISQTTLKEALFILESEGYNVYGIGIPQVTNPGKQTNTPVLCKSDIDYKDVYQNMGDIQSVGDYHSIDGGSNWNKREYPSSVDSKRIYIRYGDDGGAQKDGVIEIRRGVDDLNLGNSHYAQVRILVDGTHYLKGMAMYSDDMPDGADIVFNTNKKTGTDKLEVLKKIKEDPDNPFGAYIKANGQSTYFDKDGVERLSAINKLKEEGDWDSMSRNLSSQFLSKQPLQLIKKQLNLTYSDAEAEFDEIQSLTNPTVKKKMLLDFADQCDGAVVHLKAAALPRQKTQVILPITALNENEVYAPNYENGERVALIRYPHGGTFEIPVLTVNNKNRSARSILGNVTDAIGINPKVAERLSGADFDGDQVVVIPTSDKVRIKSTPALKGLEGFDPKTEYSYHDGMKVMTKGSVGKQMGSISNLITDMTLKGAPESELVRAVKHSMVVIDAEKHKLDYKRSEKENGIAALKKRYQGYTDDDGNEIGGASTLLSRRKQDVRVPERQGSGAIDPVTGKVTYKESGRTYVDPKTGKDVLATTKVKLLNETEDVRTLSSGTPQENAYADYANKMKALANRARKEYKATGKIVYSSSAKETYQKEVSSLNAHLNVALMNAPRERKAQAVANSIVKAKIQDNPSMDKKEIRKASQQAIYDARASVGASGKETRITITDKEWEAIQAGAITDTKLSQILRYADPDVVKQRATPRATTQLSSAKINKISSMSASGYSTAEIAKALGVSPSTVSNYLKGKE